MRPWLTILSLIIAVPVLILYIFILPDSAEEIEAREKRIAIMDDRWAIEEKAKNIAIEEEKSKNISVENIQEVPEEEEEGDWLFVLVMGLIVLTAAGQNLKKAAFLEEKGFLFDERFWGD
jgi:hypothetical protein